MRKYFHVPDNYFLSHSVGCLPKSTANSLKEQFFDPWHQKGGGAWESWLNILTGFRTEIAGLLGVDFANICPQTNVSSALTKILYSLPKRNGRNVIVLSEQDFPTTGFVLERAKSVGFEIRFVRGDVTDMAAWADAIDDHTALVHITHALSNTSHLLPVDEICELTRRAKAISVVDIAQSVGIAQIKTASWQPDFMTGTSVKFICGGPGACFMYASDEMIEICEPVDVGWFSHENPFEMEIEHFKFATDALRFLGGTPSPAPLACASNALRIWQEAGLFDAQMHAQNLLDRLIDIVPPKQLVSPRDRTHRGGTLVIMPTDAAALKTALDEAQILYDTRLQGFRFSVHGYTSHTDTDNLKAVLNSAL